MKHLVTLPVAVIRIAVLIALPRLRGNKGHAERWGRLFIGWLTPAQGGTTITAPTTGKASNVARRAWKNKTPLKGTVSVPLTAWNSGKTPLIVKASSATPTVASQRIAITNAVDKIVAAIPQALTIHSSGKDDLVLDGDAQAAVSVDPHRDGVTVTAYYLTHGEVRQGG